MENVLSELPSYFVTLKEWALALCVIPATLLLNTALKPFLFNPDRWPKNWSSQLFPTLWPSISKIVFILGLTLIVELAPLEGRAYVWLSSISFVVTVLLGLNLTKRAALLGLQWASQKRRYDRTFDAGFVPLLQNIITIFILLAGGIIILKHFGYDVMSLVTALGVSSLAVALAAKDTLSNMFSGFILIMDRNLKPGDRIYLNGTLGDVKEIGLRSTQIRTTDGNNLIVPNSSLVNNPILNLSLPNRETCSSIQIRVPYEVPFTQIKAICLDVGKQLTTLSKERPISIALTNLSDGHQLIGISLWTLDFTNASSTVSEFNERLLARFDQEKIHLVAKNCGCDSKK